MAVPRIAVLNPHKVRLELKATDSLRGPVTRVHGRGEVSLPVRDRGGGEVAAVQGDKARGRRVGEGALAEVVGNAARVCVPIVVDWEHTSTQIWDRPATKGCRINKRVVLVERNRPGVHIQRYGHNIACGIGCASCC